MDAHTHAQFAENGVHHLHQLQFIDLGAGADDIYVALVKLAVAALLGTVGPPDGLDLETLEREGDIVLVLHHIAGERHGEVITKAFLANLGYQGFIGIHAGHKVARVQDAEQKFVAFFAVFAQQRRKVLHGGRFYLLIAVGTENAADGVEDIIAVGHFLLAEVARAFRDTGLLDGHKANFLQK